MYETLSRKSSSMTKQSRYMVPLNASLHLSLHEVGAKARRLSEMMAEGFPVPAGWIIPDRAYRDFCEFNSISYGKTADITDRIVAGHFPADMEGEISRRLKDPSSKKRVFAVRSSSCAEDAHDFSMAGQFDTFLNVEADNVFQAIKKCWASRFRHPVTAYLEKRDTAGIPAMGVIIQEQIQPDFSGVLFTMDPVNRSTDYLVIEWVEGLGEKLVSGKVVPEMVRLRRTCQDDTSELPGKLGHHIKELKRLALKAEKMSGQPVDMEWCCRGDDLHILQSRPITGIFNRETVAWTNANMAENFPFPLAPLAWSTVDAFYYSYMRCALRIFGWNEAELARINGILTSLNGIHCGRIYYNLNSWYRVMHLFPIGKWLAKFLDTYIGQKTAIPIKKDRSSTVRGPTGNAIELILFWPRLITAFRSAGTRLHDLKPIFFSRRTKWRQMTGKDATQSQALSTFCEILNLVDTKWQGPVCADLKVMISTGLLEVLIERWMTQRVDTAMAELLQGIKVESTEPVKLICAMARLVSRDSRLARLMEERDYQGLEASLSAEQRSLLDSFMDEFGARCYHDCMLVYPTFEERHDLYWDLVRGYLSVHDQPDTAVYDKEDRDSRQADTLMARLSTWQRMIFRRVLASAREAMELRERGRLFQSLLFGELRRVALVLGHHLCKASHIEDPEDIFYLQLPEIEDLIQGKFQFPETIPQLVELRKEAYSRCSAQHLPELLVLEKGRYCKPAIKFSKSYGTLHMKGLGVSTGRTRGRVRIVLDPASGHNLGKGDILVTTTTDPGWTPLFFIAQGLVLERGGMLSHGAIVAREFGIPAVVDVEGATTRLKDGQLIEIDGYEGTVRLISGKKDDAAS